MNKLRMRSIFLFALLLTSVCAAQTKKETSPKAQAAAAPKQAVAPQTAAHEMTPADVEAFLDGFMPMQLERENIAGAVVLIVKNNQVLFAKGYGYADVKSKKPVTVDATLFRPGSISKLFTWTAVMQLVEQGKVDLDHPVNEYIDFKIPDTFGKPVTVRNLMTHTPGFQETEKDLLSGEQLASEPVGQYLRDHMPAQIFPPGTTPAYSNYGAALAGYIVQRVSGEKFDDYIRDHIFKPLDMNHSTFTQPLPADLKPLMSSGYEEGSGKAKPFEFLAPAYAPAGSLSSTAADISHFMMAHLSDGKYGNAQILKPETVKLMHSRAFGLSDALDGMCLGFYEESRNGHRIIGHGGDTVYFHSDLHLIQDANLGFFVSYNSAGKGQISPRSALWYKFLDRYFPYQPPTIPEPATAKQDASSLAGYYMSSRRSQTNFLDFGNAIDQTKVVPNDDGSITIEGFKGFNGEVKKWREIGPMLFREIDGQDKVAFKKDANSNWELAISFPAIAFQEVHGLTTKIANQILIGFMIVVLALALLTWPVAAIARKHYGIGLALARDHHRLRLLARVVCALQILFFAVLFVGLSFADNPSFFSDKTDIWILLWEILGVIAAAGVLIVVYYAVRCWAEGRWVWTRIFETAIALACVIFVFLAVRWHMINFNLNY